MSYIITAILPQNINWELVKPIISKFNKNFELIKNESLFSQLSEDVLFYKATKDSDDNGSVIGIIAKNYDVINDNLKSAPMHTYGGWGSSIRGEWADFFFKNLENLSEAKREEVLGWIGFLNEMLRIGNVSKIGLLVHFYTCGIEEEKFDVIRIKKVMIDKVDDRFILEIDEDVIYEFVISE